MVAQGHLVFAEAASGILAYIGPSGIGQSALARKMNITKQAAQQFVDAMAARKIILRLPNPKDARGKIVVLSVAGKRMLTDANTVKLAIEAEYRAKLGDAGFAALQTALAQLARQA